MSLFDDTAADVPVRDFTLNLPKAAVDTSGNANARVRQDVLRMSREELEDRFLRLNDENLHLKQHINKQDDKIKKLATKLMRLVKDRSRLEQLAAGVPQPASRVRDVAMEEMIEELQDNNRSLQSENEGLKQRLRVAKQQIIHQQSRRTTPYGHIHSRVNSGLKKLRDTPSPSPPRPKSATRSLDGAGRPPTGQLPRYGHSLLEDARAEIRNLENVIESQGSHIEQLEGDAQLLRDELRKKEELYEERLLDVRQQQTSNLRSHVNSNVTMIKLQKQLAERSNAITELEGRFLQLQESQKRLKTSHDTAMAKVDELSGQLRDERLKSLDLENQLKSSAISNVKLEQLQDQISELEQEKDLLKENNNKLLNSAFDQSQQQKWQIQEKKLKLQISQLEIALQADLVDKNEILDKVKAERDANEKLTEENKKIHVQFLEQKQQLEEMKDRLKFYSKEGEYNIAELTEALLLIKKRKSQKCSDLGFLKDVDDERNPDGAVRELRAAYAETIQELEKTRSLLSMESKICRGYKAELEAVSQKLKSDKIELEQRLGQQAKLLDSRAAKIKKLEAQLKDIAYGTKAYVFKPDVTEEDDVDEFNESLHLERGENLLELHFASVSLSPSALETLSDTEPSTFCTYSFYLFDLHSTPVVTGRDPKYGFTSKYVVSMDDQFLDYLNRSSVTVELHQALGLEWRTLATGQLRLQPLLEQDGKIHGTIPLIGLSDEVRSFGSLDYWLRLRIPMRETMLLYKEKVKAVGYVNTSLNKPLEQPPLIDDWNQLCVTIHRCRGLRSRNAPSPSPYAVYRFYDSPDYPTATVHDSLDPQFDNVKLYSVLMDVKLHQYLKSNVLQFYVFDDKEEQMDVYLGKAKVPLLSLAQDKAITGVFELSDPSGLPSGHIEVSLKWKLSYLPPLGSDIAAEEPKFITKERPVKEITKPKQEQPKIQEVTQEKPLTEPSVKEEQQNKKDTKDTSKIPLVHPNVGASKAPLPKLRQKTLLKEGPAAKKVTFVEASAPEKQPVSEVTPAAPQITAELEEEDEEEESHFSEGQIIAVSSQSYSDDSDQISEDIMEDVQDVPQEDQSQSTDSDDCIVQAQATGRKASERIRVEVVSLSLRPESRVSRDDSVVQLFVEYSLLDLPTEETPVSLPKPPQGKSINFNYSKVIPVDVENHAERRQLLRSVLQGKSPEMERIRFTLVSEPPKEEEQEKECEDVGVAFLPIPEILKKKQDLTEAPLNVLDLEDNSEVIGVLTVSVEGLDALESIMEDAQIE